MVRREHLLPPVGLEGDALGEHRHSAAPQDSVAPEGRARDDERAVLVGRTVIAEPVNLVLVRWLKREGALLKAPQHGPARALRAELIILGECPSRATFNQLQYPLRWQRDAVVEVVQQKATSWSRTLNADGAPVSVAATPTSID